MREWNGTWKQQRCMTFLEGTIEVCEEHIEGMEITLVISFVFTASADSLSRFSSPHSSPLWSLKSLLQPLLGCTPAHESAPRALLVRQHTTPCVLGAGSDAPILTRAVELVGAHAETSLDAAGFTGEVSALSHSHDDSIALLLLVQLAVVHELLKGAERHEAVHVNVSLLPDPEGAILQQE